MAYHLVQAGGEFRRNFPDKQEWVDIKKDFTCVVRAVARLFKELLIWAKNDEMGTVQIFDTGFGFQLKNLKGQGDPVVELKRLLSAVGEMYPEPAEREFLMKLVAVDNAVFEAAWRTAQESLKLEKEAEKLLKNVSKEAKDSLDEQQDNNSDDDSSLMSEEDYYVGILAKGGERLRNGLILNWPKSSPTVSANKPVAEILEEDFKREGALLEEYCSTHELPFPAKVDVTAFIKWKASRQTGSTNKSAEEVEEERIRKKTEEIMKEYGLV